MPFWKANRIVLSTIVFVFFFFNMFFLHFVMKPDSCLVNLELDLVNRNTDMEDLLVMYKTLVSKCHMGDILKEVYKALPPIYMITPTYTRATQKADLTRLIQTLQHIAKLHWILVEDSQIKSNLVKHILHQSGLSYTHLNVSTPPELKLLPGEIRHKKPRGVMQRNLGLKYVRKVAAQEPGIVYFGDDDNTYDVKLFPEIRSVRRAGIWPVGLSGELRYEGPLCANGRVQSWLASWKPDRPFPIDMAGFAVHTDVLLQFPNAFFKLDVPRGYQETSLLQQLVSVSDLEPRADSCRQVLVWHTRTVRPFFGGERRLAKTTGHGTDLDIEV